MEKKALITGIAGQDGSYLAEMLIEKGYKVHGTVNSSNTDVNALWRLSDILDKVTLHSRKIESNSYIRDVFLDILPDEVYHLASNHEVNNSIDSYISSRKINLDAVAILLDLIATSKASCRFFYASSSRIFSETTTSPQNELVNMCPDSIYGLTKVAGMNLVKIYREKMDIFACSGILYNHESYRRSLYYLPKKVTVAAAKIKLGIESQFVIGDVNSRRDWGFSGDFVDAMWRMLQSDIPKDYIIGTGSTYKVSDILDIAFESVNLDWHDHVIIDRSLVRVSDKVSLVADISKIKKELGWSPSMHFPELIKSMVDEGILELSNYEK
jgi:GDPmannose 4,6-dehydratase